MVLLLGISNSKAREFWESVLLLRLDIWTQETNWGGKVGGLKVWPGVPLAKWLNCHTVELQNFWVERDFQVSSSRSEILFLPFWLLPLSTKGGVQAPAPQQERGKENHQRQSHPTNRYSCRDSLRKKGALGRQVLPRKMLGSITIQHHHTLSKAGAPWILFSY